MSLEPVPATAPGSRLELLGILLMSLAAVGSAWCGYQSARWDGVMATRFNEATAMRTEISQQSILSSQGTLLDVALFAQYASAVSRGDTKMAEFLRKRQRPEMRGPFEAWLATSPLTNPDAPLSPFQMPGYGADERSKAQALDKRAAQLFTEALSANQVSDDYVLLTVLLAAVLFFAGISGLVRRPRARTASLVMAAVMIAVVVVRMATFPIE